MGFFFQIAAREKKRSPAGKLDIRFILRPPPPPQGDPTRTYFFEVAAPSIAAGDQHVRSARCMVIRMSQFWRCLHDHFSIKRRSSFDRAASHLKMGFE